jgi:hypothetical protein
MRGGLEIVAVNQRDQELNLKNVQAFADTYAVPVHRRPRLAGRSRRTYGTDRAFRRRFFIDSAGTILQMQPGR